MAVERLMANKRRTWAGAHHTTRRAHGQGLVEYALVLLLVAVAAILVLQATGHSILNVFAHVNSCLNTTSGGGSSTSSCTTGGG